MCTFDVRKTVCNICKHEYDLERVNIRRCFNSDGDTCPHDKRINVGTFHVNGCHRCLNKRDSSKGEVKRECEVKMEYE